MRRTSVAGITALCAGALLAVGGASVASAAPPTPAAVVAAPAAVPAESTTTLPLFGAPLTIDITSGPGGAFTDVSVNPADGMTATTVKPNKVRFVNEAGTARVDVVSKHGGQRVTARAGTLADVSGPGSWSGEVFGPGTSTTVNFTIAAGTDGSPDITGITSSDATATISDVSHDSRGDRQFAGAKVTFTSGTQARSLWIVVQIGSHDNDSVAKLSVGLSSVFGQKLPTADVVGAQTWTGLLCDGSTATINYSVNDDGTIADGSTATPATATVDNGQRGVKVTFSDHERVSIRVKTHDDQLRISVSEKIRCDSADPMVNTPISEPAADDGDDHDGDNHDGDHSDGGFDRDHDGRHGGSRGGDDSGTDDKGGDGSSNGG